MKRIQSALFDAGRFTFDYESGSMTVAVYPLNDRYVVFDFYRAREEPAKRIRLLDDFELAALHVNYLAVAALELADLRLATPYTILARGDLEAADGRVEEALRYYRRAARIDPTLPEPHLSIARLTRLVGRFDEARREAERALKLDPDNSEAKEILAGL